MTNETSNTASMTNETHPTYSKKWSQLTETWADYPHPWTNPQDFDNETITSASMTNESLS